MHLNQRQRLILVGVLRDEERLADMAAGASCLRRAEQGRQRLRAQQARAGLVPMNLAGWIGHSPTNSECVLFHREYARLEDMGLVERCNLHGGRRTSYLRLTRAGRAVAEDLSDEDPNGENDAIEPIDLNNVEFLPIELPDDVPSEREGT